MRVSRRIDRSACGALLSTRAAPRSPQPTPQLPFPLYQNPPSRCIHGRKRAQQHGRPQAPWFLPPSAAAADPASGTLLPFLLPSSCTAWSQRQGDKAAVPSSHVRFHNTAAAAAAARLATSGGADMPAATANPTPAVSIVPATFWRQRRPTLSKEELRSFVDPPPDGDSVDEHLDFIRDPYLRRYAPAAGPELAVSHTREDAEFPTWKDVQQADEAVQRAVFALSRAVGTRLRNPARMSAAAVYDTYRQLPGSTRMAYLPASLRHQLLKALGMVEKKDAQSMLRYFAVIADVKDGGFTLWKAEWNAAISFASRYVGASTASETEAALALWREMEQEAGLPGNEVTFNILFDVASKAGNFTLAEMVYQEMETRGLRFNRYHHVSLIHFFGLKMDADGVRTAYQEMVDQGELIDVVVLNCVLAGFLRCGEEDAADRVYARMRQSAVTSWRTANTGRAKQGGTSTKTDGTAKGDPQFDGDDRRTKGSDVLTVPPSRPGIDSGKADEDTGAGTDDAAAAALDMSHFASQKVMTSVLMMLAKVSKGDAGLRAGYQHLVPTRPDLATYRILINHYAVRLGNLAAVTRFLRDMQTLRIPLHGAIFLALFKGFALHGGPPGTSTDWSEQRLRSIWAALLKALDEEAAGLYISTWLIVWVLRAFDRCSATPEMVFKAYNSLSSRWTPSEADADFAIGFLHSLLRAKRPPSPEQDREQRSREGGRSRHGGHRGRGGGGQPSILSRLGSHSYG
ncbi:pentatricopeptide repeat protein [Niveomyces insectorum RCEF 264]|uniref:Pentatricopeptide repeat protein n=1 Tax=Niveomyces insectorum RCEF 264 TaxID=1081102 RepID=A0A162MGK3_9HYPO|nr:pentatricopeptide repeat protein [Niveomyces insectorum RCEF 264]